MPLLTVYARVDCSLCEAMVEEIEPLRRELGFELDWVDIDRDPALVERYGERVPVLALGDDTLCEYFLDPDVVREWLGPTTSGRHASLHERIFRIVREIPAGRVATYGQIAAIHGATTPRVVGYAMAAVRDREVPWHRVLNSQGRISTRSGGGGEARQRERLEAEGIAFSRTGRLDFGLCGWPGPDIEWLERHGYQPAPAPGGGALDVSITDAVAADFAEIGALNEMAVPHVNSVAPARWPAFLEDAARFRVARVGAELAGFVVAYSPGARYDSENYRWFVERYERFLYVDRLVVDAAYRARGVARRLYADLEGGAGRAVESLCCEVNIIPPNEPSTRFHRRQGFRAVGRRETEGGAKAVRMLMRRFRQQRSREDA